MKNRVNSHVDGGVWELNEYQKPELTVYEDLITITGISISAV